MTLGLVARPDYDSMSAAKLDLWLQFWVLTHPAKE